MLRLLLPAQRLVSIARPSDCVYGASSPLEGIVAADGAWALRLGTLQKKGFKSCFAEPGITGEGEERGSGNGWYPTHLMGSGHPSLHPDCPEKLVIAEGFGTL